MRLKTSVEEPSHPQVQIFPREYCILRVEQEIGEIEDVRYGMWDPTTSRVIYFHSRGCAPFDTESSLRMFPDIKVGPAEPGTKFTIEVQ